MAERGERITPTQLIAEYQRGQSYNSGIDLAERVQRNEDFFVGDQWKDVNAPDLDKPVFNILKRVGNFFISNIVSDDIGISLEPFLQEEEPAAQPAALSGAPVGMPTAGMDGGPGGAFGDSLGAGALDAGLPGGAMGADPAYYRGEVPARSLLGAPAGQHIWTARELGELLPQMMKKQLDQAMELMKIKPAHRYFLRDALVDGDACFHFYFDSDADPQGLRKGGGTPGMIRCELLDNTAVHFGNPQSQDVQSQPYILLQFRVPVKKAQDTARENGFENWESIAEDQDEDGVNLDDERGKTTVLRRYWKAKAAGARHREDGGAAGGAGTSLRDDEGADGHRVKNGVEETQGEDAAGGEEHVFFCEVSADGVEITPATDTGLTLYPLVWMCWERVKNRFHGQSAVEGLLPNQITINKLYAMAIQSVKLTAFPKIAYDRGKIHNFTNKIGEAVAVAGDPTNAVASVIQGANMSPQVTALLQDVISTTRDTMGASDAALGNVNPDNTSAIIAVQRATSMPLELQKLDFYRVVEDEVRIWLDMMAAYYGVRPVEVEAPAGDAMTMPGGVPGLPGAGMPGMAGPGMMGIPENPAGQRPRMRRMLFDFESLAGMAMRLNVEIGGASYWSELNEVSTADALISKGIITDPVDYLERVPDGYIKDKAGLIESIEAKQRQAQQMQQMQAAMQMGGGMPGGAAAPGAMG